MQVNSATDEYSLPSGQARAVTKSLDKEAFLRLLVEQLKNQDPMNPQDTSQFIAQLATFSSLEQLTNLNEGVQQLRHCQDMMQASTLIGKQVEIESEDGMVTGTVEKVVVGSDNVKVFVDGNSYDIDSITLIEADESAGGSLEQLQQLDGKTSQVNLNLEQIITLLEQLLDK
ncbi:flagellar hook capping FlgD N-terminal domain-containing protein [Pelotomaculum propionicicum]|uniref:flagellar hook capping FlgD N-terminal domain-containing protein n=1 Tax=Pelotomaculum propionicicum TaxID=258475 RepID=UPI003B7F3D4D